MPLYEYECVEHGNFDKISGKEVEVCPVCGRKCKRLMGKIAHFVFRGKLA